jgi:hypothetical protein
VELLLSPFLSSVLVCIALTALVAAVDIAWRAKAGLIPALTGSIVPYFLLMAFGNVVTTLLGSISIRKSLPPDLLTWMPLFAPFFGVFGFEGIISNTNVSIFGKGIISFPEWLGRARDSAVAAAVKKEVQIGHNRMLGSASYLHDNLSEEDLNTFLTTWCGQETVTSIEAAARASKSNIQLAKALELATKEPERTKALMKQRRKQLKNP